jgi:hypothetical protein
MDLRTIVVAVLKADTSHAFTFDEVVKAVAARLESDVREALNDLARKERIIRHIDGRDHPWRYQAFPIESGRSARR